MRLTKFTGVNAIPDSMEMIKNFLHSSDEKVFFLTGASGIGKKTALRKLLRNEQIVPILHDYNLVFNSKELQKMVDQHPNTIHVCESAYYDIFAKKELFNFFNDLSQKNSDFQGKFILIADNQPQSKYSVPNMFGASIEMSNHEMLDYIAQELKLNI